MKDYDKWNEIKKDLNNKKKLVSFKERGIYWANVGLNIGFETNGKGNVFFRPVLVLRKFSKESFIGIPLTTAKKDDMFHFKFNFTQNTESYASISQIRLFDAKRLNDKIGVMKTEDFNELKLKIKELIKL